MNWPNSAGCRSGVGSRCWWLLIALRDADQDGFEIGQEALAIHGSLQHKGRADPVVAPPGDECRGLPMAPRGFADQRPPRAIHHPAGGQLGITHRRKPPDGRMVTGANSTGHFVGFAATHAAHLFPRLYSHIWTLKGYSLYDRHGRSQNHRRRNPVLP